jgi:hypothetical protein
MRLATSRRRSRALTLLVAFIVVVVASMALFWGIDMRFDYYGGRPGHRVAHIYMRGDWGELGSASEGFVSAAVYGAPLAAGVITYVAVILVSPGWLGRTRWRYLFGVPVAAVAVVAVFLALLAPLFVFPERTS